MDLIYQPPKMLADLAGIPLGHVLYIISFFIAWPFAHSMKTINLPIQLKHLYTMIIGLLIQTYCYHESMQFSIPIAVLGYLILTFTPREYCHIAGNILASCFMVGYHIYMALYNYGQWQTGIDLVLMIMVFKISALGYNIRDGGDKLKQRQLEYRLLKRPNAIEYFAFIFWIGGCLGSPFFEYKDYNDYMQRQGPFKKLPNTFWPAAKRMSEAFVCLFFYITLSLFFDLDYLKSDAYYEQSWYSRLCYMFGYIQMRFFMYFCAFALGDVLLNSCGIAYSGDDKNGKPQFDRFYNVRLMNCYGSYDHQKLYRNWNSSSQRYLSNYVYKRQLKPGAKPKLINQISALFVSAIWHGVYPGYFWMFTNVMFYDILNRKIILHIGQFIKDIPVLIKYPIICLGFCLLEFNHVWRYYSSFYFLPEIMIIVAPHIISLIPLRDMPIKAGIKED